MRQALALVLLAPAIAGCSLLYNPNNLPNPHDAGPDAEIILDADPSMLVVTGVAPAVINEGQGDGGSPPALLVIAGHQMVDANTTIELIPEDASAVAGASPLVVGTPVVAKDGDWIAVPITSHVDGKLGKAQQIVFDVQVSEDIRAQPGMRSSYKLVGQLTLQGLDELAVAKGAAASIDTTTLQPLYSQVDLESDVTFTKGPRAIVHAVSSIKAQGITANGKDGSDPAVGSAWIGGCGGGGPSSDGLCSGGRGGKGNGGIAGGGGGGGGGGFSADGSPGTLAGNGGPGAKTGDDLIVTYDGTGSSTPNKSEGGGGGGPSALIISSNGGSGGGGGGTVELTAGGDVTVGAITAKGGKGQDSTNAAGGGGGAGGLVMLRAGRTLSAPAAIAVDGGAGGAAGGGSGTGGAGAAGRVRWDAAKGSAPASVSAGTSRQGPAFTLDSYLFRDPAAKITVDADKNVRFSVYAINFGVDGQTTTLGGEVSTSALGTASFTQMLSRGLTQLCLTLDGGMQGASEADKCVFVAYLP
jgi:hypothetical protein